MDWSLWFLDWRICAEIYFSLSQLWWAESAVWKGLQIFKNKNFNWWCWRFWAQRSKKQSRAFRTSIRTPLHYAVRSPSSRDNLCPLSCGWGGDHWLCCWGRIWCGRQSLEETWMKQTKQKKTFTAFHKTYVVILFFFFKNYPYCMIIIYGLSSKWHCWSNSCWLAVFLFLSMSSAGLVVTQRLLERKKTMRGDRGSREWGQEVGRWLW